MQVHQKLVRNYTPGRGAFKPEAIVIHIAEGGLTSAQNWFNDPLSKASAHYMVGKTGTVWQFVKDENTAWHAGGVNKPSWGLLKSNVNTNLYTIGIEHEGKTGEAWTPQMYAASAELIAQLCQKWQIPLDLEHVIGHNRINSVSRDRCPGSGVNFAKLISQAANYLEDPEMIKELQSQINKLKAAQTDLLVQVKQLQSLTSNLQQENAALKTQVENAADPLLLKENQNLRTEIERLQTRLRTQPVERSLNSYSYGELLTALASKVSPGSN